LAEARKRLKEMEEEQERRPEAPADNSWKRIGIRNRVLKPWEKRREETDTAVHRARMDELMKKLEKLARED
jgi:hypothetical protein